MSDEVKFIFKTLFKVPVIIFVSFFILNIFAFFFIYFKVLGASYVVMQTAVENNYLPRAELNQLVNYVCDWNSIPMVSNAGIVIDKNERYVDASNIDTLSYSENDARRRQQYGGTVTCGARADYVLVWPLSYRETMEGAGYDSVAAQTGDNVGVNGWDNSSPTFNGFKSEDDLQQMREEKQTGITISLYYTVPGLKYYPDLLTY